MNANLAHVLVVDDDDRLRDLLEKFLSDHDFMVVTAPAAAEVAVVDDTTDDTTDDVVPD